MKNVRFDQILAVTVAALAIIAGVFFVIRSMNRSDAADARTRAAAFSRANRICGRAPARIKTHGTSWSFGPWLEVFCQDGTTRAIVL